MATSTTPTQHLSVRQRKFMPVALPAPILALFAPRPPLRYLPPIEKPKLPPYTGVAEFMKYFEDPDPNRPKWTPPETPRQRRERKRKEREEKHQLEIKRQLAEWKPELDEKIKGKPRNTIIVARLSYKVDEKKLKEVFSKFGPVRHVRVIRDLNNNHRGYGFVEFEYHEDMRHAYKYAHGMEIEGRKILVDVERGRLDKGFLPRRLGGGLGKTRKGKTTAQSAAESMIKYERRHSPYEGGRYSNSYRRRYRGNSPRRGPPPRGRRDSRDSRDSYHRSPPDRDRHSSSRRRERSH